MNISAPFVARPVATTLLTAGIALAGGLAFWKLPAVPLPRVDYPTITVSAYLPGAGPETVASSVATPLERHLGQIAGVSEMTSESSAGETRITLQFDLNREIDGAARDVQAAINAARVDLPASLTSNPTYNKVNLADAPILILAMTSKTMSQGQMYDAASNVLQQRLSQISGIGQVGIGGASPPAIRVELNPQALFKYGIGLEDIRAALASANANSPKGSIDDGDRSYQIYTNDQAVRAADYAPLIIAYRDSAAVRLADVAEVTDSVENVRNLGLANGRPSVLIIIFRQPGANIIDTTDNVKAALPHLLATMPADVNVAFVMDRSTAIRASLFDTECTVLIAIGLVILVVSLLLHDIRVALIPVVAVPVSILGTFGAMYLLNYSLDIFSLMALTIATGLVADDAIVVLDNISRYLEAGMSRMQAALRGVREVEFVVLSISLFLVALFIPILLIGGVPGRLFREFTVTLSLAILISVPVSLSTTPMMCALFLQPHPSSPKSLRRGFFQHALAFYERTLIAVLRNRGFVLLIFLSVVAMNFTLFYFIPKGFFPLEDTGILYGWFQADQSASFKMMSGKLRQMVDIVQQDPAVQNLAGFTGAGSGFGGSSSTGALFVSLKPISLRSSINRVIARLQPKLAKVPAGRLFLGPIQEIRAGSYQNSQYQYTLLSDSTDDLYAWTPKLVEALEHNSVLTDVSSDLQQTGLESTLYIDRDTASRLGITPAQIDNTLYDAFGQRQVSVIYGPFNQYHVVMELAQRDTQDATSLRDIYVATSGGASAGTAASNAPAGTVTVPPGNKAPLGAPTRSRGAAAPASASNNPSRNAATNALATAGKGSISTGASVSTSFETMIPLAAVSHFGQETTPLSIRHQGAFVASAISFNLREGASLSEGIAEISNASSQMHMPASIHGELIGVGRVLQKSLSKDMTVFVVAIATVYILLGILYESYLHPITVLSTLPAGSIGALAALMLFDMEFDIIAMIGVILLIGIVSKNAIMMIDFAIEARRTQNLNSYDAILQACRRRFRPILMTTTAAMVGAMPLALSFGNGAEIRKPLGIAIMGGLVISQLLTLYTTPVLYLYMDRLGRVSPRQWRSLLQGVLGS
jgi:multidrug efflux pump